MAPGELAGWVGEVHAMSPGRLYGELRAALLPLYDSDAVPLTPAAAAADLGAVLPPGGLVCALPGRVGLWIARTLPTTELGSVHVPPVDDPALAAEHALRAAAAGRPTVLVTGSPLPAVVDDLVARAGAERLPLITEVWHDGGHATVPAGRARTDPAERPLTRDDRRTRLAACFAGGGPHRLDTAVDLALTSVLESVAGPVTAW